jgi:hypothetical protein
MLVTKTKKLKRMEKIKPDRVKFVRNPLKMLRFMILGIALPGYNPWFKARWNQFGSECPAMDLDYFVVPYHNRERTLFVDMKHATESEDDGNAGVLAKMGGPACVLRISDDFVDYTVKSLNPEATVLFEKYLPAETCDTSKTAVWNLTEKQYVIFHYAYRGLEIPQEVLDFLDNPDPVWREVSEQFVVGLFGCAAQVAEVCLYLSGEAAAACDEYLDSTFCSCDEIENILLEKAPAALGMKAIEDGRANLKRARAALELLRKQRADRTAARTTSPQPSNS